MNEMTSLNQLRNMKGNIRVKQLSPFVPNSDGTPFNPFHQDFVHVGSVIGNNVAIMEGNKTDKGDVGYIVVINLLTGERKMLTFFDKWPRQSFFEWFCYLFSPQKDVSVWDKIRFRIRSTWNYHPWLKWAFAY